MAEQPTNNQPNKKPLTEDDIKEEPASKSNNTALKVILIVIGVIAVLSIAAFAAIGWAGRTFFDRINDSVEISEDSIRIGDEESGMEVSGGEELSEDFPTVMPLYEPSDLQSSSRVRQNNDVYWYATFRTDDSKSQVTSYYESALDEGGWEVTNVFESDDVSNITASYEASQLTAQVSIIPGGDTATEFNLTVIDTAE